VPHTQEEILLFAEDIAKQAGRLLLDKLRAERTIDTKDTVTDLVTDADRAAEALLVDEIERRFPSHSILGEEGTRAQASTTQDGYVWVLDPLDGTVNYTHQLPMFAVSVGVLLNGAPLVGVVYLPVLDECFCASRGQGTTLNGQRVHVSTRPTLRQSVLATGFSYDKHLTHQDNVSNVGRFIKEVRGLRRMGSASIDLAYVSCGRLDGYWEEKLKPWDVAAGVLLVEEAGGVVTNYHNRPFELDEGRIVASNPLIHSPMIDQLKPYVQEHAL
tara:strand:+ start:3458 stop:4273 length:816 start_codon:yes stop_codon:yes gene_type:complete